MISWLHVFSTCCVFPENPTKNNQRVKHPVDLVHQKPRKKPRQKKHSSESSDPFTSRHSRRSGSSHTKTPASKPAEPTGLPSPPTTGPARGPISSNSIHEPLITSVAPSQGSVGTNVSVTGTNLTDILKVTLGFI